MKILFSVTLVLFLVSCTSTFKKDPVISFVDGDTFCGTVDFETSDSVTAHFSYWTNGSRKLSAYGPKARMHSIQFCNLLPGAQYQCKIELFDGENNIQSSMASFVTDTLPAGVLRIRKDKIDSTVFQGYLLIRRFFKSGADALIDKKGDLVWYHRYDTAVRRAFTWTNKQSVLSIYDSAHIKEIDLFGNTILDLNFETKGLPYKVHHEVLSDGEDLVALSTDSAQYDLRKFGGSAKQFLRGEALIRFSRTGKLLWSWNLFDHADPRQWQGTMNLLDTWGHANSIAFDTDGNYLVSFRDFNQIWKIDRMSGAVIWRLGEGGDFQLKNDDYFIRQHSVHLNSRGEIMIFDNGDLKQRPNSRIMAYHIDEKNRKAIVKIKVELPRALSSYRMCSAYMIEPGKYLVCTTRKDATLAVVNDSGQILWKVVADNASYRAYYIDNPFQLSP